MIRAKFTCQQNTFDHETHTATVILTPVTSDPPNEENIFWRYTPVGNITLQFTNPAASAQFSSGTSYYVDFTAT